MKLCVNTDYSGFVVNQSQAEIDAYVLAIVTAIPNCTHITVNTYLDYPTIISRWATAIRANGKIPWFRTWGYNFWQGKNGVAEDTTLDALTNHRSQIQTFIANNASIFQSGDVWSAVPDEPENWGGWAANYTSLATAEGKAAYNSFIQGSIADCNTAFATAGITGVDTGYVATNPSTSLSTIDSTTAALLTAMLIDAYFDGETGNDAYPWHSIVDPHIAASTARYAVGRYVNPSQDGKAYHYNMGVNIYIDLNEKQQADSYNDQMFALIKTVTTLDGITVWPAGRTTNPGSRLFTYSSGTWTARQAASVVNQYFGILARGDKPDRKLIV